MAKGVNPNWIKSRVKEIDQGTFRSVITGYNPAAQWLISFLSQRNISVKVAQLGAGVKRITVAKHIYPKCHGEGEFTLHLWDRILLAIANKLNDVYWKYNIY